MCIFCACVQSLLSAQESMSNVHLKLDLAVATRKMYCHLGTEIQSLCSPDYITMAIVHGIDLKGIVGIKMINVFSIMEWLGYPFWEAYGEKYHGSPN